MMSFIFSLIIKRFATFQTLFWLFEGDFMDFENKITFCGDIKIL